MNTRTQKAIIIISSVHINDFKLYILDPYVTPLLVFYLVFFTHQIIIIILCESDERGPFHKTIIPATLSVCPSAAGSYGEQAEREGVHAAGLPGEKAAA